MCSVLGTQKEESLGKEGQAQSMWLCLEKGVLCVAALDGKAELLPLKNPVQRQDGSLASSGDEGFWIIRTET